MRKRTETSPYLQPVGTLWRRIFGIVLLASAAGLTAVLGGVRPSGARRSWWLRDSLASEEAATPHLATAAPPLRGTTTADVGAKRDLEAGMTVGPTR